MKKIANLRIKTEGFTLVELSIVIIIIGFLIASISAGQSLIKQSKLNAVINEVTHFRTDITTFLVRYGNLPGDIPDATAYWSGGITTDGNGDGYIIYNGLTTNEGLRAWQHLNLSGIMPGNFTGLTNIPVHEADITNSPSSIYSTGLYSIMNTGFLGANWSSAPRNVIWLGAHRNGSFPYTPLVIPGDAQNIDIKMDDGLPRSGKVGGCINWQCFDSDSSFGSINRICIESDKYAVDFEYAACELVFDLIDPTT